MPIIEADLSNANSFTCALCDPEDPKPSYEIEPHDPRLLPLCFRHAGQIYKSGDPLEKRWARSLLFPK
jgi:hypothetical protein